MDGVQRGSDDLMAELVGVAARQDEQAALDGAEVGQDQTRRGMWRRLAARGAAAATATLLVVAAAVVVATSAGAWRTTTPVVPVGSPSLTASPTPTVTGWVPGAAPCGEVPTVTVTGDPDVPIDGAVTLGRVDPASAGWIGDPRGSVLLVDATVTGVVPGAVDGSVVVRLVDESGTVAFWNDPARRRPQVQATENSHFSSLYSLWDAVDCRTGLPLEGSYRVLATAGDLTVELAPMVDERTAP